MAKKSLSNLSRRERQIMDIVYRQGAATAAEVQQAMTDAPGYSAVRAMLRVLEEKGHLKHAQQGPRYVFQPTVNLAQARRSALKQLLQTFFDGSAEQAVAALLDISGSELGADELDRLEKLIDQAPEGGSLTMFANLTWVVQMISEHLWPNLVLDMAVKGTLILLAVWLLSLLLRRRSASVRHSAWTFAIAGLLILPILSATVPAWQLPILPAGSPPVAAARPPSATVAFPLNESPRLETPPAMALEVRPAAAPPVPTTNLVEPEIEPIPNAPGSWSWPVGLLCVWLAGAFLVLLPIPVGMLQLGRLARRGRAVKEDGVWSPLVGQLAKELGLARPVRLRWGQAASMPLTWGVFRSIVLLPREAESWTTERRRLVLLHELAHVKRCDCLTQLAARLACALYWFHPLAWLAARRLRLERELACDDRVLETGARPSEYAWHLLDIARSYQSVRHSTAVAISMARESQLQGRLQAILEAGRQRRSLGVGRTWAAACTAAILLIPLAALKPIAEATPVRVPDAEVEQSNAASPSSDVPASEPSSVRVTVRDVAGKPIPGARVFCVGAVLPNGTFGHRSALPKNLQIRPDGGFQTPEMVILAEGNADEKGLLTLAIKAPNEGMTTPVAMVLGLAPGYGICGSNFATRPDKMTLTFRPEIKIKGQLLNPAGVAAKGVRVRLVNVMVSTEEAAGILKSIQDPPPAFWPADAVTDAQGRFTIDGFSADADASLTLVHPDFAQEDIHVSSKAALSDGNQAFEIKPYQPEFKHVLEPARPVQGRIIAADTKKPVAGVLVEATAMGTHGGMPFYSRTDEQGRYRVSGHGASRAQMGYFISIHPAADSGFISQTVHHDKPWPAGAKFLEKNFELQSGRLLHGQVLEAESKKPIVGASIIYQPMPGNPFNRNGSDMRETVLTGNDGKFTITGLPGKGVLVAEGPQPDYVRVLMPNNQIALRGQDLFPHGFVTIEVPEKGDPIPATISLRKGPTLEARVVRPDGSPVDWIFAGCRQLNCVQINRWQNSERFENGFFRLTGCDPNETYRVFFIHPKLHLGAVADLKYDGKVAEVRLQPTGSARGKIVMPDDTAPRGVSAYAMLLMTKEEGKLTSQDWFNQDKIVIYGNLTQEFRPGDRPDAGGSFLIENLIPGAQHYITAGANRLSARQAVTLKPGEIKDVGVLKLAKEER